TSPASSQRGRLASPAGDVPGTPGLAAEGGSGGLLLAEVGPPNPLVLPQRLCVVRERNGPDLEYVPAIGCVQRHERILLDQEDRRALRADLPDDVVDPLDKDRGQPE